MTEASSKRPTQLLEDLVDQRNLSEGHEVKVIEKQKVFQARMDNYVRSLKRKNETVTPLKFKRRAVEVCAKLQLVYDDLPMDWKDKLRVENVVKKREPKLSTPGKESCSISTEVEVSKVHHGNGNFKRLVDFTKLPPPPYWTKKFAEGMVLPRVLTMYSGEVANYLMYDYNPRLQDVSGNAISLPIRKRHSYFPN